MTKEIDYAAVLADLEARKAVIEAAIAGIKIIVGSTPIGASTEYSAQDSNGEILIAEDAFLNLAVSEAARKFMRMSGRRPQTTQAICNALQRGGLKSSARNFYSNVHTALTRDAVFMKVSRGKWGLVEWYPPKRRDKEKEESAKITLDNSSDSGDIEIGTTTPSKGKN